MKILHLSTFDIIGGAARSAYRLHEGLQSIGADSKMLVQKKASDNRAVISPKTSLGQASGRIRSELNQLSLLSYPHADQSLFSPQWVPDGLQNQIKQINPSIINLHWVANGFLQVETLAKLKAPLVWTFHDMWAFTGGCHYNQECNRYTDSCGQCPQLKSKKTKDLSHKTWQRKAHAWESLNLTIITPSLWLAKCTSASQLFKQYKIKVIPYGLNTEVFKPIDKCMAREALNLPQNKKLVLFGAGSKSGDPRKGFQFLLEAFQHLDPSYWKDSLGLVIFGESASESTLQTSFSVHFLGKFSDDVALSLAYSAADVFVAPSMQDNLPNTVLEALACGTPCLAFDIGGMPDMIDHQQNGYLATPYDVNDLAQGIKWILKDVDRYLLLSKMARQKVEQEFKLELQAHRYLALYKELLNQRRKA